jgi:asparagine synthase (glutamine-hydrolysing)
MAGLCGVIGKHNCVEGVATGLEWTGDETTAVFEDNRLAIAGSFTTVEEADQPVPVGDDAFLWIWGSVFGFEGPDGYHPRTSSERSTAHHCARLYDRHGMEFVSGLNGDFVGVVYDRAEGIVSVFTDRLGLRDTYYAQPTDETLVFSTAIQSLSRHPEVTPAFDPDYVSEYFGCHFRTFGLKTPLDGTYLFHPGAVTSVDTGSLTLETDRYWTPRYRPLDRPFSYFVEEFSRRFAEAVADRLRADRRYGLLLSGGVDSRLVLAATGSRVREQMTAYHMAGWRSREQQTAETVAEAAGVDFEWLRRDAGYHERALSRNPALSNFVGRFEQAHAEGFIGDIRDDIDEMVTASFADSNFKGYSFPRYRLRLGSVGAVDLPRLKPMDSVDSYVDFWTSDPPSYLDSTVDPETVFRSEIEPTDEGVDHHGVTYGSPEELFTCGMLTPRSNGSVLFTLRSLQQHLPAWSPYVDNRLVDLYLSMPKRYFVRYNVVMRALERLDPELAGAPVASSGLSARYPEVAHLLADRALAFSEKYLPFDEPPAPHLTHGPWPDVPELVRDQSFVPDALKANERAIRELPFLDWDGVWECYRAHQAGANNHNELYGLLTLLEMPVTRRIVDHRA